MSENVKEITDSDFDVTVKSGLVMVDFWAPWCGPCQMMTPVVEAIGGKVDYATVCKINVDDHNQAAAQNGVQSIPTFVFFKDGKEVGRMIGAQSEDAIIAELEKNK